MQAPARPVLDHVSERMPAHQAVNTGHAGNPSHNGEYSNYSVFDVDSNDELHAILSNLPLFTYMAVHVTPLAVHPSDIHQSAST